MPLFGANAARFANPAFTSRPWNKGYGVATESLTLSEVQAALGDYWQWANRCVAGSKLPEKVRAATRRRALRVPDCGKAWRIPVCTECGHRLTRKARLVNGCDSMTCVLCARRAANRRRAALFAWAREREACRVKGKRSRDFYLLTVTVPKRCYVSVERIQQDATVAFKATKAIWEGALCYLPNKKGQKRYPGKCADAGMVSFLEVGAGGMVHVTSLVYGAWHRIDEVRPLYEKAVPGGKDFELKAVGHGPGRKERLYKAVAEVCKYVTKGSVGGKDESDGNSKARHEYTHPLLCVLAELALLDRNRIRCYGTLRGVFGDDQDDDEDERRCDLPDMCPGCGSVHLAREHNHDDPLEPAPLKSMLWEWQEERHDYAWAPKGWGRTSAREPPDG